MTKVLTIKWRGRVVCRVYRKAPKRYVVRWL
jgi:hypothetical protein